MLLRNPEEIGDIPRDLAAENPFADVSKSYDWVAQFAVKWYNACYGNMVPQDQTFLDIVAKAMSCAVVPISNNELASAWTSISLTPKWYKYNKLSQSPLFAPTVANSTVLSDDYLKKIRAAQDAATIQKNYLYTNEDTHQSFRAAYIKLISESMLRLCNLLAYMGAITLRNLAKDEQQMGAGYLKINFHDNVIQLAMLNDFAEIPAPHTGFVTRAAKTMTKGAKICKIMLAHCLALFITSEIPHHRGVSSENVRAIIKAAALTHLQHSGMAVCSLFVRAMRALPATAKDLARDLECSALKPSLVTLGTTFRKYGSTSKTWWWARAFDDGYLLELTWKNHQILITVLSTMLQSKRPMENSGIMEAIAIKSLGEDDRSRAIAFAEAVLEACYKFEVTFAAKN